jgi:hypothetical protein
MGAAEVAAAIARGVGQGLIEVARRASAAGATVVVLAGAVGDGWERMLGAGVTPRKTGRARFSPSLPSGRDRASVEFVTGRVRRRRSSGGRC